MARGRSVTTVDEEYKTFIGRGALEKSGIRLGERLVLIPFSGGIILGRESLKKFAETSPGFAFEASKHEAAKYLKRLVKNAG